MDNKKPIEQESARETDSVEPSYPEDVSRKGTFIALVLAICLIAVVLTGAKFFYHKATHQPVALTAVNAPDASSPECEQFNAHLPANLGNFDKVALAEPAPLGAAAYTNGKDTVTIRCGISAPVPQYNELTSIEKHAGGQWMALSDTLGTGQVTWYLLGRIRAVAVTGPEALEASLENLKAAVDSNPESSGSETAAPSPIPLSALPFADGITAQTLPTECFSILDRLPDTLEGRSKTNSLADGQPLEPGTVAYTAPRSEAVVVRCGIAPASDYAAGATLQQVDDVPWFNSLAAAGETSHSATGDNAASSTVWYALGLKVNLAVSLPSGSGNDAITTISTTAKKIAG